MLLVASQRNFLFQLPLDDFPGVNTLQTSTSSQDDDLLTRGFSALEMGKQKIENAQQVKPAQLLGSTLAFKLPIVCNVKLVHFAYEIV